MAVVCLITTCEFAPAVLATALMKVEAPRPAATLGLTVIVEVVE